MLSYRNTTHMLIGVIVSTTLTLTGCSESLPAAQKGAPQVGVFVVKAKKVSVTTELSGRTSPYQIAEVRPQVGGIILKRLFHEGADVKAKLWR